MVGISTIGPDMPAGTSADYDLKLANLGSADAPAIDLRATADTAPSPSPGPPPPRRRRAGNRTHVVRGSGRELGQRRPSAARRRGRTTAARLRRDRLEPTVTRRSRPSGPRSPTPCTATSAATARCPRGHRPLHAHRPQRRRPGPGRGRGAAGPATRPSWTVQGRPPTADQTPAPKRWGELTLPDIAGRRPPVTFDVGVADPFPNGVSRCRPKAPSGDRLRRRPHRRPGPAGRRRPDPHRRHQPDPGARGLPDRPARRRRRQQRRRHPRRHPRLHGTLSSVGTQDVTGIRAYARPERHHARRGLGPDDPGHGGRRPRVDVSIGTLAPFRRPPRVPAPDRHTVPAGTQLDPATTVTSTSSTRSDRRPVDGHRRRRDRHPDRRPGHQPGEARPRRRVDLSIAEGTVLTAPQHLNDRDVSPRPTGGTVPSIGWTRVLPPRWGHRLRAGSPTAPTPRRGRPHRPDQRCPTAPTSSPCARSPPTAVATVAQGHRGRRWASPSSAATPPR